MNLPEWCYIASTKEIGIVRKGVKGYCLADIDIKELLGDDYSQKDVEDVVNKLNDKMGISKDISNIMKYGSMFGWYERDIS